jgi:hypothetical protein
VAIDRKYGRVTTEHGIIGADEPVIVFRAQDKMAPYVIEAYRQMCMEAGSPQHHLDGIEETYQQFRRWQETNFTKVPESA